MKVELQQLNQTTLALMEFLSLVGHVPIQKTQNSMVFFRLKKHLFWLLRMPMILGEKVNQTKEDVLIKQVGEILFSWTLKEKSIQLFKIS